MPGVFLSLELELSQEENVLGFISQIEVLSLVQDDMRGDVACRLSALALSSFQH